jgi:hypothetical protein
MNRHFAKNNCFATVALCLYLAFVAAGSVHKITHGHLASSVAYTANYGSSEDSDCHHDETSGHKGCGDRDGSSPHQDGNTHECFICKAIATTALSVPACPAFVHIPESMEIASVPVIFLESPEFDNIAVRGPPVQSL